jgi:hypothetical protein
MTGRNTGNNPDFRFFYARFTTCPAGTVARLIPTHNWNKIGNHNEPPLRPREQGISHPDFTCIFFLCAEKQNNRTGERRKIRITLTVRAFRVVRG